MNISHILKKNAPLILTTLGVGGMIFGTIEAVKATPKAEKHIEESKAETRMEKIKATWKDYAPAVAIHSVSAICLFSGTVLSNKSQTAITGAYALLAKADDAYKQKVKDIYGIDAHNQIVNEIRAQEADDISITVPTFATVIGDKLDDINELVHTFYEPYSKTYFNSTFKKVLNAQYHFNRNFCLRGYASMDEYLDFLGITPERKEDYTIIGWNGYEDICWVDFHNYQTVDKQTGQIIYILDPVFNPEILSDEIL